jgi:PAS domain S-box-containing protein
VNERSCAAYDVRPRRETGGDGVFRTFFDRSGIRAAFLDDKLRVVEASVDFVHAFGRPAGELRGHGLPDLLHPSFRSQIADQFTRLLDGQRARFVEWVLAVRSAGSVFGGELTGLAVHGDAGRVDGLMVLMRPERDERTTTLVGHKKLLSDMDARILEGVASGASTVQLASLLYLSRGGVEYHLTALLRSMKVRNRSALVSKAYSMGLFSVGSWPPRVLPEYVN